MSMMYAEINRIHFKFVYLVKLLSNRYATLSPENIENISSFEDWSLTLIPH